MKIIFKIVAYYPDENMIEVKFCDEKSTIPIDNYKAYSINCDYLDMTDSVFFSDSLVRNHGLDIVEKQIDKRTTNPSNISKCISDDEFNLEDLVGKVIEGKYFSRPKYPIKMKRIDL
tara:strand:- start:948 stop:1298 length:351 start_codon:yes stop_codon:yes gene_type:complete